LKIRHKDPNSQDDPENPNFGDGNFSVERIPETEREDVAGDDVDLENDEMNSSKRARADTTSSERLQISKPPAKKGRRFRQKTEVFPENQILQNYHIPTLPITLTA